MFLKLIFFSFFFLCSLIHRFEVYAAGILHSYAKHFKYTAA